jgi:hypothetical protein
MNASYGSGELEYVPARPVISQQMVHVDLRDERVQDVLKRISELIKGAYADAEFVSYIGTNPLGIYLEVYTARDEFDGILRLLSDRLGDLHVATGVNVCVVPLQKRVEQAA